MTCKDCIHSEVCLLQTEKVKELGIPICWDINNNDCSTFQDKSKFIELPCKVGDTVYSVWCGLSEKAKVMVDTINYFIFDEYGLRADTNYLSGAIIGETYFLTKEEAEEKLKELNTCQKK